MRNIPQKLAFLTVTWMCLNVKFNPSFQFLSTPRKPCTHRLIKKQIEYQMSSFQYLRFFSITMTLRQNSKGVTRMLRWMTRQKESMRVTPLGFCLRVIVNENPLNLEKTKSSVLSELLSIHAFTAFTTRKNISPIDFQTSIFPFPLFL